MVDAPFDEGNDDGFAVFGDSSSAAQPAPVQMQMQVQQEQIDDDVFGDAAFPTQASSAPMTIETASGAQQNLDDDLTEEEKVVVAQAAEY